MASNGSLKLKSASLLDMYNTVHTYEETVQDALYAQYIRPHINLQSQII